MNGATDRPCGAEDTGLTAPVSPPGRRTLDRQLSDFHGFLHRLVAAVEQTRPDVDGPLLGRSWDLAGDPAGLRLAELWAFVADGVAAYTALTAGECYLGTARDWTDLQRIVALTGFRPQPRVAARGWVKVDVDVGASPTVPAGTRVQAPGTTQRAAQTFEVVADTVLRADWAGLTATAVPVPTAPSDRTLRFLLDPGFAPGDRVLFVAEQDVPTVSGPLTWFSYWGWLLALNAFVPVISKNRPVAVAVVTERAEDLGTVVVTFDRDLTSLLPGTTTPYAAYRIVGTAGSARRVTQVVRVPAPGTVDAPIITGLYPSATAAVSSTHVVLDAALEELSAQRQVALVDWNGTTPACDIATVSAHRIVEWPVVPGTTTRASRLEFAAPVAALTTASSAGRPVTAYVVDRRVPARTYVIPDAVTATPGVRPQVRIYPAPAHDAANPLQRLAIRVGSGDGDWQVFGCAEAQPATQEAGAASGPDVPRGMVLDLLDDAPDGPIGRAPATANLAPIRHGAMTSGVLGSGDAARAGQVMQVPKPPVAHDVTADGNVVSSLEVRVDGVRWQELPTLSGAGPVDAYSTELTADGGMLVRFGDGEQGNRPTTGKGNVTQTHRVGGGSVGELPAGAIDTLLGSIRGVVGVRGAGATVGGADGDDERRIARLAPTRSRALGRAVSRQDLADLALSFPGVSHATAWRGAGPPGHRCGANGEHVAFLRADTGGRVRAPVTSEVRDLAAFLEAHRDPSVPLCVAPAAVTALGLICRVAVDPRFVVTDVVGAVAASVAAAGGPLDPLERRLGQPLDRSDVVAVVHAVPGVLGLSSLVLTDPRGAGPTTAPAAAASIGRVVADRYRLLVLADTPDVTPEPT
ncbi:hypothetical protein ACI797_11460 [Geodermatophilus sp. SYSU D00691]